MFLDKSSGTWPTANTSKRQRQQEKRYFFCTSFCTGLFGELQPAYSASQINIVVLFTLKGENN
jgi:hypothetical protein